MTLYRTCERCAPRMEPRIGCPDCGGTGFVPLDPQAAREINDALYWYERWLLGFMTDALHGRRELDPDRLMRVREVRDLLAAIDRADDPPAG